MKFSRFVLVGLLAMACLPASAEQRPISSTNPLYVIQVPADGGIPTEAIAPSQVTVAATATQIAAARIGRTAITIENTGTVAVYIGNSNVTTTTGMLLPGVVGASITIAFSGAVYGIAATGTEPVTVLEKF